MRRLLLVLVFTLAAAALLAAPVLFFSTASAETDSAASPDAAAIARAVASPFPARVRGMTLDAVGRPTDDALPELAALGVTHLALIPYAFQRTHDDPNLRFNPEPGWYSESTTGARALAAQADTLGMQLIVKPQLWLGRDEGEWSATIGFDSEERWRAWEARYRDYLLYHAGIAQEIDAALLVIGTEMSRAVQERPAFWRSLADTLRTVYDGPLTYAANWHDDAEFVTFWDALDVIGLQAYYPLAASGDTTHTVASLCDGWKPHAETIRALSEQWDRPILFTEVGYRSVPYAAAEPWRWPERGERGVVQPDTTLQRQLYAAFFETWWDDPAVAGAVFWKWKPPLATRPDWHHEADVDGAPQDGIDLGFTPRGHSAERVLARWFAKSDAAPQ
ncbi:MAG: hypothetical protein AAFP18_10555 [Bacteroidota bacterium]